MSAGPSKAPQGVTRELIAPLSTTGPRRLLTDSEPDALQALLAFSSLHVQVCKRKEFSSVQTNDRWQVEQFMLDEVLQLVAERALAITGADGVAIALAEENEIVCRGSAGAIAPDAGARLDPNSGFSGTCFRSGQIIRCDDAEHDPRVNLQAALLLGARSMVAVPLAGRNCIIGLIEVFSYDAYGFNDSDVRSLSLLSELILAALRPEEEDRLAEVSRQVKARADAAPAPVEIPPAKACAKESTSPTEPVDELAPVQTEPDKSPAYEPEKLDSSRPGLAVVAAVLLVALALGCGVWWKFNHSSHPLTAAVPTEVAPPTRPIATSPSNPEIDDVAPQEDPAAVDASQANSNLGDEQRSTLLPQVTGVRHWSSTDSSTVVIDLQDEIQYEAHKLANPERIYVDLHDTALVSALARKTMDVGDALLTRIRVAQPMAGVTRVVLDTKAGSNFSVSLQPNPYRLIVEVRPTVAKAQVSAKTDLFAPANAVAASSAAPSAPTAPVQASSLRIVLDAGHGGWDLGTVGRHGLLEKNLTLDIVQRLGGLIEKRLGAEVVYTRNDDNYIALDRRAEIANQSQADLFVSIHANNSDSASARGVETYYTNTFSSVHAYSHDNQIGGTLQTVALANVDIRDKVLESRKIATDLQRSLYGALVAKNPGIRDRGVKKASYVVLTGTSMPAVLAEVSFVSSPADETNLQSGTYRQGIAEALYKGIARYADTRKVKMASAAAKPTMK